MTKIQNLPFRSSCMFHFYYPSSCAWYIYQFLPYTYLSYLKEAIKIHLAIDYKFQFIFQHFLGIFMCTHTHSSTTSRYYYYWWYFFFSPCILMVDAIDLIEYKCKVSAFCWVYYSISDIRYRDEYIYVCIFYVCCYIQEIYRVSST